MLTGKHSTFEEIKREALNLNLGQFIKFSKDFSIELPKTIVSSVFKRTALYSREMYFTNFKDGLIQLMKEINKIRIEKIKVEHKNIKTAFNEVAAQEASLEEGEVSSNKEALDNLK
jgi:hypothetical protein